MDKELLYNKSGIKDVTAYKAILRSGGGTTNMNNYEINKGEIWEKEIKHQESRVKELDLVAEYDAATNTAAYAE